MLIQNMKVFEHIASATKQCNNSCMPCLFNPVYIKVEGYWMKFGVQIHSILELTFYGFKLVTDQLLPCRRQEFECEIGQ